MEIKIQIEKIVYGGNGLARSDNKAIFVPFSAIGDVLLVDIVSQKKDYATAVIKKIIEPSKDRVRPFCRYYGECGGCQLQHISYSASLEVKRQSVIESFKRIAKIDLDPNVEILSAENRNYRNRAQFKYVVRNNNMTDGFCRQNSNYLVQIDECPILHPQINIAKNYLLDNIQIDDNSQGELELLVGINNEISATHNERDVYSTNKTITIKVLDESFTISPKSFFQSNRFMLDTIASTATQGLSGDTAIDLFGGVGFFSAFLSKNFKNVLTVENNNNSSKYYIKKPNCKFVLSSVDDWLLNETKNIKADLVLLDPPRMGMEKSTVANLASYAANEIVYVSCNPPTMARDIAMLIASGYKIEKFTVLDMFPHTYHIECVARLKREVKL